MINLVSHLSLQKVSVLFPPIYDIRNKSWVTLVLELDKSWKISNVGHYYLKYMLIQ